MAGKGREVSDVETRVIFLFISRENLREVIDRRRNVFAALAGKGQRFNSRCVRAPRSADGTVDFASGPG